jgi:hypothetical protein
MNFQDAPLNLVQFFARFALSAVNSVFTTKNTRNAKLASVNNQQKANTTACSPREARLV